MTNTVGTTGEQTLSLEVFDEVVDRKTVTVPPGGTRTVRFTQQFAGAGDYTLIVGGDERSARTVAVRPYEGAQRKDVPLDAFVAELAAEVDAQRGAGQRR